MTLPPQPLNPDLPDMDEPEIDVPEMPDEGEDEDIEETDD
jgi:hypothetical protein